MPPLKSQKKYKPIKPISKKASYAAQANRAKQRSDYLNSPRGLISETIKGIPAAAKSLFGAPPFGGVASGVAKGASAGMMQKMKMKGYKKGGKVKKTGPAKLHKGERVLTTKQAKKFEKVKKQIFGIKKYGKN